MAVYRVEKTGDYTVLSNYHLRDPRLKLGAKGLLSLVLSLPEDWEYSIEGLAALGPEGKDAVRSAVKQLEAAGYITRQQSHDSGGQFSTNEYVIRERPVGAPPLAGFPSMVEPSKAGVSAGNAVKTAEKQPSPLAGFPSTVKPSTVSPSTENPTQLNKDIQMPPKAPQGGRRREAKEAPDWKPERFNGFWKFYPRGEAKQQAIRAWDRLRPSDELIDRMGRALKRQMQSADWLAGVGVPYASTWLNQRRWEDEVKGNAPESEAGCTIVMPEGPIWT